MRDNVPLRRAPLLTALLMVLGTAAWIAGLLHGGILALASGLLALMLFGPGVEDTLGRARFAALVVACGLAALAMQLLAGPAGAAPTLAAGGAVAALAGAYLVLRPRAQILTVALVPLLASVVEVPAVVVIALWLAVQVLLGAAGLDEPLAAGAGASWFAHLGALVLGAAGAALIARRRPSCLPAAGRATA